MTIEEEDKKDGSEEKHEEEEVCPAAAHLDKAGWRVQFEPVTACCVAQLSPSNMMLRVSMLITSHGKCAASKTPPHNMCIGPAFDPAAYLESFYKTASEDTAMQIVLFFLPGILYRLPRTVRTALDLGAGPTVYIPIAMRSQAVQMFTSDYARVNRDVLQSWIEDKSAFDWSNVCRWISNIEAAAEEPAVMQQKAREKVDAVLETILIQLVSTIFCLEYSCETLEAYNRAVRGACSLIEDGGYLMQGGVMDATSYNFGGKTFKCHQLKRSHIEEALKVSPPLTSLGK
ncbi:NNMT/PNMT/TEMT family protein [Ancylostoma ceylanicum]|uniref:NNMT/PNMT/TEMT family protein n=1 Tax=Ancylostoma ceylanicum TaxID=53326 RepID=A0A0D6M2I0_9BILA|nr:NNMT/PNMT/TEMT family protein [Ancylostoma ceylanicum]